MAQVRIPAPGKVVIEPKSGLIARDWYYFFHSLVQRSGGEGDATLQTQDDDLDALAALSSTGILARTAASTYALRSIAAGSGVSVANGNGVSGNPTVTADVQSLSGGSGIYVSGSGALTVTTALQVFEVTVGQGDVASGGTKVLLDAATGEQWKIREMRLSGGGTDFSGGSGDRLLDITDGTTTWSVIPAATLQSLAFSDWGNAGLPAPATPADLTVASASGTDIVAQYSGGTADYTDGSLTLILTAERVA